MSTITYGNHTFYNAGSVDEPLFKISDIATALKFKQKGAKIIFDTLDDNNRRTFRTSYLVTRPGLDELVTKHCPDAQQRARFLATVDNRLQEIADQKRRAATPTPAPPTKMAPIAKIPVQDGPREGPGPSEVITQRLPQPPTGVTTVAARGYCDEAYVYLVRVSDMMYKFGITERLDARIKEHETYFANEGYAAILVKSWKCKSIGVARKVERRIKEEAERCGILDASFLRQSEIIASRNGGRDAMDIITRYVEDAWNFASDAMIPCQEESFGTRLLRQLDNIDTGRSDHCVSKTYGPELKFIATGMLEQEKQRTAHAECTAAKAKAEAAKAQRKLFIEAFAAYNNGMRMPGFLEEAHVRDRVPRVTEINAESVTPESAPEPAKLPVRLTHREWATEYVAARPPTGMTSTDYNTMYMQACKDHNYQAVPIVTLNKIVGNAGYKLATSADGQQVWGA